LSERETKNGATERGNRANTARYACLSLNLETTALDHYIIAATEARPSETVKNSRTAAVSGTPCYAIIQTAAAAAAATV